MYEKRFLCGVDGVSEDGSEMAELLFGGVWDRVPSVAFNLEEFGSELSGEWEGAAWGTEPSNSSARSNVENVRFASSAVTPLVLLRM